MVAIARYYLIALFQGHLHSNDDRFLANVKMAKPADEPHAVELASFFLEAADQQHLPVGVDFLRLGKIRNLRVAIGLAHDSRAAAMGCIWRRF